MPAGASEIASRYPSDTYFKLYQRESLMQMGALDAWETSHGGSDVVVAVVGTGVAYEHRDLAAKMWRNVDEVPANGMDDDANGYADDVVGWSFPDDTGEPIDIPGGRGTMMAGMVAAHTNNDEGIAGVSWGARIMALKTLRHDPDAGTFVGTIDDQVEAVCYAADNGASVLLFGGYLQNPNKVADDVVRLEQAIDYAHAQGVIVVAPAGDCGLSQPFCPPEDEYGANPTIIPAAFRHVIAAQSFALGLQEREEASHGWWVDISAPGEEFMATSTDPPYSFVRHQRATSDFATAHVAGVAAVLRSINPDLSPLQVEAALCETATRPRDVPFEFPPGAPPRNDRWGCGAVNFEKAVESVPPKLRIRPLHGVDAADPGGRRLSQMTDGLEPWPRLGFANEHLSVGAWQLSSDVGWLTGAVADDLPDGTSGGDASADLDTLRLEHGPLQSGSVYTAEIKACASQWDPTEAPCQSFDYRLTFVERLERVYLPIAAR
jgi:subtilisin family serine protease